jgi:hypothetical protein
MNRRDAEDTEILKEKESENNSHRATPDESVLEDACGG